MVEEVGAAADLPEVQVDVVVVVLVRKSFDTVCFDFFKGVAFVLSLRYTLAFA